MRHQVLHTVVLFQLFLFTAFSQSGSLAGVVRNSSDLPLSSAHVAIPALHRGVTSDGQGRFYFEALPTGSLELRITHIGYRTEKLTLFIQPGKLGRIDIVLTESSIDFGSVTVVSTRSEEMIREIPQPVFMMTSEQLLRSPAIGVADALDSHAGVSLIRDGAWGSDVNIRGLGRDNTVLLIDGARIETASNLAAGLSLVDVSDVDRIELIRGAASTLYGSGATGGVVNIITKSGGYGDGVRLGAALSSSYASADNRASGAVSINAGAERWYARIHGSLRRAEDVRTPAGQLKDSRFRDGALSTSMGVRLGDDHELTASYQFVSANDVGIPGGASLPLHATARYPSLQREFISFGYVVQKIIPGLSRLSFRYIRQQIDREVEIRPGATLTLRPSAEHVMDAVQVQSNWSIGTTHRLTAGIDVWQREYTGRRLREMSSISTVVAEAPLPDATFRSIGFYGQDELYVAALDLRATLGLRADIINVWNKNSWDILYIERDGVRDNAPQQRSLRWTATDEHDLSWSAHGGLLYTVSEYLDITCNIARSFRAPSLEERYQFIELGGAVYIGDPALVAEKGTFIDIGARIRHERFTLAANVFSNFMRDLVVDEQALDTLYVKRNIGRARLYGLECTAEYNPFAKLLFYGTASWVRGENTGDNSDLPGIPPFILRIGARHPIVEALHADITAVVTADQDRLAVGENRTPGSAVFNFAMRSNTLRFGNIGVNIYAGVENLFDRAWRRHLSTLRGMIRLEPGRNLFFRLRFVF